ncbi:MAG: lysoplasmalogenase [Deltaproteobacteria bacterium]|nr:lysoplasmalogenase [Deltaproteobacteria bacterium]MBW2394704.1 lysoplasmalogenase [Deltaproteobacteria bacterium]
MTWAIAVGSAAVAALLLFQYREFRPGIIVAKLTAASSFVWACLLWGGMASAYGQIILVGLMLCWLGDALLLPPGQSLWFQLGIGAFLAGHLAYAIAFLQGPLSPVGVGVSAIALSVFAFLVLRWLAPHVPPDFKRPVVAYLFVISVMVVLAIGSSVATGRPAAAVGAVAFALSDVSVSRDRFVAPGFVNGVWGLPLYFASQFVLASTVLTPLE